MISFESLTGDVFSPNYHDMYIIADRLSKMFGRAKIIVVTREKNSMLRSLYSQYIKEGGILTFGEFKNNFFKHERLEYDEYIRYLEDRFDVLHLMFEELKNNPHGFVDKICEFIGVPIPSFEVKTYNVGYTDKQVEVQRLLNHLFKTRLNPHGLPPQRLWEFINPAKLVVCNRVVRRLSK